MGIGHYYNLCSFDPVKKANKVQKRRMDGRYGTKVFREAAEV
jgi:hypothetical protein